MANPLTLSAPDREKVCAVMDIGEFFLSVVTSLVASGVQAVTKYLSLPYFQRRKIERRIEDITAEVVEPLLLFLSREGVAEEQQHLLVQTLEDELRPLMENRERLFRGSLDGQQIFESIYADRVLPKVIVEAGLKDVYVLLFPRVATLLCRIPELVDDGKTEAWRENFRRWDKMAAELRALIEKVDVLASVPSAQADVILMKLRRVMAQKVRFQLDLTGLRADQPLTGPLDCFYVHPELSTVVNDQTQHISDQNECFERFSQQGWRGIVIGAPGSGKSTWSKWLQRETLSTGGIGIGIRIELRDFSADSLLSLHEVIRRAGGLHVAEEVTVERISHWIEANQVLFILDGFDEIPLTDRDAIRDWIKDLHAAVPQCSIVVTSRPLTTYHLDSLGHDWQQWQLEPFDEKRIISYIEQWYRHVPLLVDSNREIDAPTLSEIWRDDPTIKPLTENPLLLSTLLMVHHLDGTLPRGRSQLYKRYVDGMLGLWDDRRKITAASIHLTSEEKCRILRSLALRMQLDETDQLDESDTSVLVKDILGELNLPLQVSSVLECLRERSGLIIGPGTYSFVHKSVGEYLVAESIVQGDMCDATGRRMDRFRLHEHCNNDRWNTVIFLWASLAPTADVEFFLDECKNAGDWELAYGLLAYQYDKIPRETRRRLLLDLTQKRIDFSLCRGIGVAFYFAGPDWGPLRGHALPGGDALLRGLPDIRATTLIKLAIFKRDISWSDVSDSPLRGFLWPYFAEAPFDLSDWKACLRSDCVYGLDPDQWLLWAAQGAFGWSLSLDHTPDIEEVVAAFKETHPFLRPLVPIHLISVVLELAKDDAQQTHRLVRDVLPILANSDTDGLDEKWLQGTAAWLLRMGGYSRRSRRIDLLHALRELIVELDGVPNLSGKGYLPAAKHFIDELIKHRDSIK